ncbi:MAG: hypothetical protein H6738_00360 [Alphaproteobacteria bacterium]|nr:hypothetical protein [Alphaproteobacteria bacterium]MCB9695219.1 hypothetical protein [Alphaproteobacteria bacterium]
MMLVGCGTDPTIPLHVEPTHSATHTGEDASTGETGFGHTGSTSGSCVVARQEVTVGSAPPSVRFVLYLPDRDDGWPTESVYVPVYHPAVAPDSLEMPPGRILRYTIVDRPADLVVDYDHDEVGRLVAARSPSTDQRWSYDAAGHLTLYERDGGSTTAEYTWDSGSRLVTEIATTNSGRRSWFYKYTANGKGQYATRTKAPNPSLPAQAFEQYEQDALGRLTRHVTVDEGYQYQVVDEYEWDAQDRVVALTSTYRDPFSGVIQECALWVYDGSHLSTVTRGCDPNSREVETYTYDARGNWVYWEDRMPDGTARATHTMTYDSGGRRLSRLSEVGASYEGGVSRREEVTTTYMDGMDCDPP